MLNVRWFGALGDAQQNDVPAMQAAIDLAALDGGKVIVPGGTYLMLLRPSPDGAGVVCLELKSKVTVSGVGPASLLQLAPNQLGPGTYSRLIMSQDGLQQAALIDLALDGNQAAHGVYANQGNGGNVVLDRGDDVRIEEVRSVNANGQGIQVRAPVGTVSRRLTIKGCTVFNCRGDGNNGIGIQVAQFDCLLIEGNTIENTVGNGIDVYGENNGSTISTASNFIIINNVITNTDNGIFPETARSGIISNNVITSCNTGIRSNRINGAPSLLQILGNQVDGCPVSICITGDADPNGGIVIQGNFLKGFVEAGGGGIVLGDGNPNGSVSYVSARNNVFSPATNTSPFVVVPPGQKQVAFVRIYDNEFYGSPNPGYRFVNYAATSFQVYVGGWIGLSDVSGNDLERISIRSDELTVSNPSVPTNSSVGGRKGQISYDSDYVYVCVTDNSWKRAALTTF